MTTVVPMMGVGGTRITRDGGIKPQFLSRRNKRTNTPWTLVTDVVWPCWYMTAHLSCSHSFACTTSGMLSFTSAMSFTQVACHSDPQAAHRIRQRHASPRSSSLESVGSWTGLGLVKVEPCSALGSRESS